MTNLSSAHKETTNCGQNYGRAKNWFAGVTQYAEVENLFAAMFDGKAYFYDPAAFTDFSAFKVAAISAFSDGRGDDVEVVAENVCVVEFQ